MIDDADRVVRQAEQHQLDDTLTALQDLLRASFKGLQHPGVSKAVAAFEGHLLAFAGLHRALGPNERTAWINVPDHFGRLCADITGARLAPRGVRCVFSADDGEMSSDVAEILSLVIAELITHAARQGFQDGRPGCVEVRLRQGRRCWTCLVRDNGGGRRDPICGEGLDLARTLARCMSGDLRIYADGAGVVAAISLPHADPPLKPSGQVG